MFAISVPDVTPDPTLPLYVPQLPNPVTHRWVADSVLADGAVSTMADVVGIATLSQATAGARPVAGVVNGLRALTFDGTDDQLQSSIAAEVGAASAVTVFTVMKMATATPGAIKIINHLAGANLGVSATGIPNLYGSSGLVAAGTTAITADTWFVIAAAITPGAAGACVGTIVTNFSRTGWTNSTMTMAPGVNDFRVSSPSFPIAATVRETSIKVGTALNVAQMLANIDALVAEYGIV